jgi:tetratricopeptide (TPR) repeat protein
MRYYISFLFLILLLTVISCAGPHDKPSRTEVNEGHPMSLLDSLGMELSEDSNNVVLLHQRARLYLDRGMINEALGDLGKVLEITPDAPEVYITLADAYLMMGKIPSCLEALQKAEELDPMNSEAMLKLAEVYLILRDYKNTFDYTRKALDIDTKNPRAYFIRGYALMETGDTLAAIRNMQNALDQDQEYYQAAVQLGMLLEATNDPLAEQYYSTAIAIDPNNIAAYYLLGYYYQEKERMDEAIETYDRLLLIQPDYQEAYYNKGYIYLVHYQDFQRAVENFTRALEYDPDYVDAWYNRGYSHELSGNYQAAREDYKKTLDLKPNYERAVEGMNRLDRMGVGF